MNNTLVRQREEAQRKQRLREMLADNARRLEKLTRKVATFRELLKMQD